MRKLNETNTYVKWESNPTDLQWATVDLGKKTLVNETTDNEILLTENDLHFMPTQEQLKELVFYAPSEVYRKLFHPYYHLRTVDKKGKVTDTEMKLIELK